MVHYKSIKTTINAPGWAKAIIDIMIKYYDLLDLILTNCHLKVIAILNKGQAKTILLATLQQLFYSYLLSVTAGVGYPQKGTSVQTLQIL